MATSLAMAQSSGAWLEAESSDLAACLTMSLEERRPAAISARVNLRCCGEGSVSGCVCVCVCEREKV